MKGENIARSFDLIDDKYMEFVESEAVNGNVIGMKGRASASTKHAKSARRIRIFGGMAAGILLAVGVFVFLGTMNKTLAANWFGIRNLLIRDKTTIVTKMLVQPAVEEETEDGIITSEPIYEVCVTQVDMIVLSGYMDSNEAKASAEWERFLDGYDQDGEILAIADKTWVSPARYEEYFVYSEEMVDRLESILQKYELNVHQNSCLMEQYAVNSMLGGKLAGERVKEYQGYGYADGTFHFDADYYTPSGKEIGFQFRRCMKGYFDEAVLNIGDVNDYEDWQFMTKDGTTVMLALSRHKGLIYTDMENCFVLLNVLEGTNDGVSRADLEAMADQISWSLLSKTVSR